MRRKHTHTHCASARRCCKRRCMRASAPLLLQALHRESQHAGQLRREVFRRQVLDAMHHDTDDGDTHESSPVWRANIAYDMPNSRPRREKARHKVMLHALSSWATLCNTSNALICDLLSLRFHGRLCCLAPAKSCPTCFCESEEDAPRPPSVAIETAHRPPPPQSLSQHPPRRRENAVRRPMLRCLPRLPMRTPGDLRGRRGHG